MLYLEANKFLLCNSLMSPDYSKLLPTKQSSWWRRLDPDAYIRLSHTSSKDVFKTSSRCLTGTNIFVLVIRLQAIFQTFSITFKTFLRRLAKTSLGRFQNLFKTSCKNFFNTSSIRLQDIFKKSCKDVFKAFS